MAEHARTARTQSFTYIHICIVYIFNIIYHVTTMNALVEPFNWMDIFGDESQYIFLIFVSPDSLAQLNRTSNVFTVHMTYDKSNENWNFDVKQIKLSSWNVCEIGVCSKMFVYHGFGDNGFKSKTFLLGKHLTKTTPLSKFVGVQHSLLYYWNPSTKITLNEVWLREITGQ